MKLKKNITLALIFCSLHILSQNVVILDKNGDLSFTEFYNEDYYSIKTYNVKEYNLKLPTDIKYDSLYYSKVCDSVLGSEYINGNLYILLTKTKGKYSLYTSMDSEDFSNSKGQEVSNRNIYLEFPSKIGNRKIGIILNKLDLYERGTFGGNQTKYQEADKNNWLNFRYTNIKYGDIVIQNKKMQIGLYDIDNDGDIDADKDFIFTSIPNIKYFTIGGTNRTTTKYSKDILINFNDSVSIKVNNIEFQNNKINFGIVKKSNLNNKNIDFFYKYDSLMSFETLNNSKDNIKNYINKGKYVFIDIWSEFCRPCIKGIPVLDSISKVLSDKITIISLLDNYGNKSELYPLIKEYGITHLTGWSNEKLNDKLVLSGYPHGILFDPNGNLVSFCTYRQLKKYINDTNSFK